MIQSVLFTKSIPSEMIAKYLGIDIEFDILPSLKIEKVKQTEIEEQLDHQIKKFIVTSQNAAYAIENISLDGEFYVVGQKTAKVLEAQNRNVVSIEDYAEDLFVKHLKDFKHEKFQFFSGSNRRDFLPEKLKANQNHLHEIVSYQTETISQLALKKYDAYAFFSPLSFEAFIQNNEISPESIVFSIGRTTTEAIKNKVKNTIITAREPLVEAVLEDIKKYQDDKK